MRVSDMTSSPALWSGGSELAAAAVRSGLVSLLAVAVAHHLVQMLRRETTPWRRRGAALLLILPFLAPRCLVAYAYMAHAQAHGSLHEHLYSVGVLAAK